MPLLNYSTQIQASKTVSEIQELLQKAKVKAVMTGYDADGVLSEISFRIETGYGMLSFRLPANIDEVYKVIAADPRIPRGMRTREQASRVAWRIVKDWLEAQLAFVASKQVVFEQVFLPYAQNNQGETVFETLRDKKFNQLALTNTNGK